MNCAANIHVDVSVDCSALMAELSELASSLKDRLELPLELVDRVRDNLSAPSCFDVDASGTLGAGDHRITLKPGKTLLELMAAMRAFDRNADLLGHLRHSSSPSEPLASPMVGATAGTVTIWVSAVDATGDEA